MVALSLSHAEEPTPTVGRPRKECAGGGVSGVSLLLCPVILRVTRGFRGSRERGWASWRSESIAEAFRDVFSCFKASFVAN
ncbi:hypothetical protein TGRH88_069780 [Toxoplasma gondii]|uniref:Uncharacterized protein n=1 Tax=Toxoplasma gondii TaxID=5811 RepID=A0A7J6K1W0_TOXGO|nr:hypothetical protein TGRH88_069780 [Toxoplasma gondii]